jgi:hypothetical protein
MNGDPDAGDRSGGTTPDNVPRCAISQRRVPRGLFLCARMEGWNGVGIREVTREEKNNDSKRRAGHVLGRSRLRLMGNMKFALYIYRGP